MFTRRRSSFGWSLLFVLTLFFATSGMVCPSGDNGAGNIIPTPEPTPTPPPPPIADADGDGVADDSDVCVATPNADQADADKDGAGDACDRLARESRSTTIAITSDNRRILVVNRETHSLSVIEVRDGNGADVGNKIAEVSVGQEPRCLALASDEREVYVTNAIDGTVSVVALTGPNAFRTVAEIQVGVEPRGCALTPNGTRLFVANHTSGNLSIIDPNARQVIGTVATGGNPWAIAITNDGDGDDTDETVFVTQFFAELVPGGPGESFDNGRRGVVQAFTVGNTNAVTKITLSPLAESGFTGDRTNFCKKFNVNAPNDTFCPDANINDANDPRIKNDPQGAFPNQLGSAVIKSGRLYLPNIGAAPEPPVKFNINVQALVHVVNTQGLAEDASQHANINAQVKTEADPANPTQTLQKLFGNDLVDIEAIPGTNDFLVVSRGGNFVFRTGLDGAGKIDIRPPNVVRFQTGNLPNGIIASHDGRRAYINNEAGVSVTAVNLENNSVITRDIDSGEVPEPGSFEHGVLVGKLAFFTALGTPDDGIFITPVRDIVPLASRGKQSDNAWSSCASCHPDGLSDRVTWIFADGPRNTIPLDAFFAKDSPADQRICNWSAVRGSVTDFNNNSRGVQGGIGFAGNPPNPNIYNHGITQGASDALDAQTLFVQTIRPLNLLLPPDAAAISRGRDLFAIHCASCHGGAKWTKSQTLYLDNPAFDKPSGAGGLPRDPGVTRDGDQIVSYKVLTLNINFLDDVGTFNAADAIEIKANGAAAAGAKGFNSPSLLGLAYSPPYFHDGGAQTITEVFAQHNLGAGKINNQLSSSEQNDLQTFLNSIDGRTETVRSEGDEFRDAIGG